MKEDIVIVAARRTPIGKFCGGLSGLPATSLGAHVIGALIEDTAIDPGAVSEVIMGQVLQAGCGQNPARQSAMAAGIPARVPAMTINKVCGAGQKSIHLGCQAILCGDADIVIAGGQDSMTRAPHLLDGMRSGVRMGETKVRDAMIVDGLWDAFNDIHMGSTVEHIARTRQISRDEQDAFALNSHRKAAAAAADGRFADEIKPIDVTEHGKVSRIAGDEHPKADVTLAELERLRPVFDTDGSITAGNSSGLNDGAAAVMVMSAKRASQLGLEPLARIASYASAGVDPMLMGLAPAEASRQGLARAGWGVGDLDVMEINEAFAAQAIAVDREMSWDPAKINVNGGAIALGHPLAASGCRIVVTLAHEIARRRNAKGIAALCIGGGLSVSICLER